MSLSASPLRRLRPISLVVGIALLVALVGAPGCGSERDTLSQARASIAAGDLDRAEHLAAPLESSEAKELVAQIAKHRARRDVISQQIDELFAGSAELAQNQLRDQLKRLRERETEKGAKDLLDSALSGLVDRHAKAIAARRASAPAETPASPPRSARAEIELATRMRAEVRAALEDKQWQRAETLLVMLADQPQEHVGGLPELRSEARAGALAEAQRLIAQAQDLERELSAREAHDWLLKHSERFPPSREFAGLAKLVGELDARAKHPSTKDEPFQLFELEDDPKDALVAESAAPAGATVLEEPPDLEAAALVELARESAARGELAYARSCALAASAKLFSGDLRDDCVGLAQDLRARITLRDELASSVAAHGPKLKELGVESIDARAWRVGGESRDWSALGFELLQQVASSLPLSPIARRGVIAEALAAGSSQREAASAELARMVERGAIEADAAAGMISRSLGGLGATQRYLLAQGKWASSDSIARSEAEAVDVQLERRFLRADVVERQRAFEALTGGASLDTVRSALAKRSVAAVTRVARSKALDQLRALAALRTAVDTARKEALELIFDEQVYFYPYNPPEPPKTAGDYARAQRDVDEAVDKLREAWAKSKPVKLSKDFLAALDELEWCRATYERLGFPFLLPASVPDWVFAAPRGAESVDLPQFAWTREESESLIYSRAVEARNERLWSRLESDKAGVSAAGLPDRAACDQVRVTNRYRAMFGRRSLAWNSKIQATARGHSKYMADTGDFGHFETDPARRTPGDRARLEGYNSGVSENCSMGRSDPASAHDGWAHSSGHHRNLLMASHREMASSLVSVYWTQNFGADRAFEKELEQKVGG